MKYIILPFYIFLILSCSCFAVAALEIKAVEENASCKIVVSGVPEKGVGGFYLELGFDSSCNITNVESNNFLVDYNTVNYTLLIAGAQGDVPGPAGDVTLCIVSFEGKPQFKIVKAIVSDVDGNVILDTYFPSPTLTHALTPTPTFTPKPSPNGGDGTIDITPSPTPNYTSTPIVTPTFAPIPTQSPSQTPSHTSPIVTHDSSPNSQPSQTPLQTQYWIPGFEATFAIAGLLVVAHFVLRRRK